MIGLTQPKRLLEACNAIKGSQVEDNRNIEKKQNWRSHHHMIKNPLKMLMQKMTLHNMGHGFYNNLQYRHNMVEVEKDPKNGLEHPPVQQEYPLSQTVPWREVCCCVKRYILTQSAPREGKNPLLVLFVENRPIKYGPCYTNKPQNRHNSKLSFEKKSAAVFPPIGSHWGGRKGTYLDTACSQERRTSWDRMLLLESSWPLVKAAAIL